MNGKTVADIIRELAEGPSVCDLEQRIKDLEAALTPFAQAAEGFDDPSIPLEYVETDGQTYSLYCGEGTKEILHTGHLIRAAEVLRAR